MPLIPEHIKRFIEDKTHAKFSSEMLNLLVKTIDNLCFKECQIDRIQCTLTPLCTRRQFLKLRMKNGLSIEDLPKFCYSVQKNIVFRDFRNKTVVYKPFDAYLYLLDFLDIYFHGDYRKLNKFISFKDWDEVLKIFNFRIEKQKENFQYHIMDNYIIFKFEERIHIVFINENFVICNVKNEAIQNLDVLKGLCELYNKLYFPDVRIRMNSSSILELSTIIPKDVLNKIKAEKPIESENSKIDDYFWNVFSDDLQALTQICKSARVYINRYNNLRIKLFLSLETNKFNDKFERLPLRYRDMRLVLNFIYRIYNDFYVIDLDTIKR